MYSQSSEPVRFERDCDVVMIPTGDHLSIPAGTPGYITQSLGGSFTVFVDGNLFRIAGIDADAIGKQPVLPPTLDLDASDTDVEELMWAQIRTCYDPEIPVNIVDLGLIYTATLKRSKPGHRNAHIQMTLTAPGCGMGEIIVDDVRSKVALIPTIDKVDVELVFDPPWNTSMMSEVARLETGLL